MDGRQNARRHPDATGPGASAHLEEGSETLTFDFKPSCNPILKVPWAVLALSLKDPAWVASSCRELRAPGGPQLQGCHLFHWVGKGSICHREFGRERGISSQEENYWKKTDGTAMALCPHEIKRLKPAFAGLTQ